MKQMVFVIGGIILIYSCQNKGKDKGDISGKKSGKKIMTIDSLPEAKWNGEYMKIKDADEPKIERKSIGSEYYNMGNVALKIGKKEITYTNFTKSKTVLSFTKKSINAFITNDQNDQIHIFFKRDDILSNFKGKYKADTEGKVNQSFMMSITANEDGKMQEYKVKSGEAEIIRFSPQLATLEFNVKGVFIDQEGAVHTGKGKIEMNFETAVMTAN